MSHEERSDVADGATRQDDLVILETVGWLVVLLALLALASGVADLLLARAWSPPKGWDVGAAAQVAPLAAVDTSFRARAVAYSLARVVLGLLTAISGVLLLKQRPVGRWATESACWAWCALTGTVSIVTVAIAVGEWRHGAPGPWIGIVWHSAGRGLVLVAPALALVRLLRSRQVLMCVGRRPGEASPVLAPTVGLSLGAALGAAFFWLFLSGGSGMIEGSRPVRPAAGDQQQEPSYAAGEMWLEDLTADAGAQALPEVSGLGDWLPPPAVRASPVRSAWALRAHAGVTSAWPLHVAAFEGDARRVAWLLDRGHTAATRNADGATPLHVAAARGHMGVVQVLLARGADPNARDMRGATPLHYAAGWGAPTGVVGLLLDKGAELNGCDGFGRTPLDIAIQANDQEVRAYLLQKGGEAGVLSQSLGSSAATAALGQRGPSSSAVKE